ADTRGSRRTRATPRRRRSSAAAARRHRAPRSSSTRSPNAPPATVADPPRGQQSPTRDTQRTKLKNASRCCRGTPGPKRARPRELIHQLTNPPTSTTDTLVVVLHAHSFEQLDCLREGRDALDRTVGHVDRRLTGAVDDLR